MEDKELKQMVWGAEVVVKAIAAKLRSGQVKNRYAARGKVKQIRKAIANFNWLAQ